MNEFSIFPRFAAIPILLVFSTFLCSQSSGEPGVLFVSHGSPSAVWNQPLLDFGEKMQGKLLQSGNYKSVSSAFLEFATPDVPSTVAKMEEEGCDRIIAVPLFIAPSGHTHFDVPAVLGLYSSPSILRVIDEEGGTVAQPKVPITLTNTCFEGDLLESYALAQVKELSTNPKEEALVILLHGDPTHEGLIERKLRKVATHCCGQTGIDYADWASIAVGQRHAENGLPAIWRALECKPRVLVIGLYVSSTAERVHERAVKHLRRGLGEELEKAISEGKVVFSNQPLISHPGLVEWAIETVEH